MQVRIYANNNAQAMNVAGRRYFERHMIRIQVVRRNSDGQEMQVGTPQLDAYIDNFQAISRNPRALFNALGINQIVPFPEGYELGINTFGVQSRLVRIRKVEIDRFEPFDHVRTRDVERAYNEIVSSLRGLAPFAGVSIRFNPRDQINCFIMVESNNILSAETAYSNPNNSTNSSGRILGPAEFIRAVIPQIPQLRLALELAHQTERAGRLGENFARWITGNPANRVDVTSYVNAALTPTVLHAMGLRDDLFQEIDEAFLAAFIIFLGPPFIDTPSEVRDVISQAQYNVLDWFYRQVNHDAPWDIKREDRWIETIGDNFPGVGNEVIFRGIVNTPEQLGNLTYGYIGAALGLPLEILLAGSVYAANNSGQLSNINQIANELEDWLPIYRGYRMFNRSRYERR